MHGYRTLERVVIEQCAQRAGGLTDDPIADRADGARLFGNFKECRWGDEPALWMFPAQQCFDAHDATGVNGNDGLVHHGHFTTRQGTFEL